MNASKSARQRLEKKAEELGANAIIDFKVEYPLTSITFARGTAVVIE